MARQMKITVETDSLLIVRGRNAARAWCPVCGAEAEMVALDTVGVVTNLDRPALEEWLKSGALHRSRNADGFEQICLPSLLRGVLKTEIKPPQAE